jgi:hypothetical protein
MKRKAGLPEPPFKYEQRVKFKTRDGADLEGKITFIGWLPFPGIWSFEVRTDAGETFKAPGNIAEIGAIEETAAPSFEKTAAGDQAIIPCARGAPDPGHQTKAEEAPARRTNGARKPAPSTTSSNHFSKEAKANEL